MTALTKEDLLRAAEILEGLGGDPFQREPAYYKALASRLRAAAEWCAVVPMEPTEAMLEAGDALLDDTVECAHNVWNAMIAAAPEVK